jgi:hypothetical protein
VGVALVLPTTLASHLTVSAPALEGLSSFSAMAQRRLDKSPPQWPHDAGSTHWLRSALACWPLAHCVHSAVGSGPPWLTDLPEQRLHFVVPA